VTTFSKLKCEIRDVKSNLLAVGCREATLNMIMWYIRLTQAPKKIGCKARLWHHRFGHLGAQGMQEIRW